MGHPLLSCHSQLDRWPHLLTAKTQQNQKYREISITLTLKMVSRLTTYHYQAGLSCRASQSYSVNKSSIFIRGPNNKTFAIICKNTLLTQCNMGGWWAAGCWQMGRWWAGTMCLHLRAEVRRQVSLAAELWWQRIPTTLALEMSPLWGKTEVQPDEKWKECIINVSLFLWMIRVSQDMKNLPQGSERHYPLCFHTLHQTQWSHLCLTWKEKR